MSHRKVPPMSFKVRFPNIMPISEVVKLNSGYDMPMIGYGTWQISKTVAGEHVREALEAGYRLIDCSIGFRNQTEIAAGIRDWCKIRKFKRAELFYSSKIWNTFHSREKCLQLVDKMLEEFDTDYMDLILIHWPYGWAEDRPEDLFPRDRFGKMRFSNVDYMETWRALEEAHAKGKVRSLGFCSFNLKQADRLWREAKVKPAVVQIELNPLISQKAYRDFCRQRGIVLCAFMPLGNPDSASHRKPGDPNLLHNETLQAIARIHGKSVPQIILRWLIDIGVTAVVKASDPKRIRANINIFKFSLTPEEITRIEALNIDFRLLNPIIGNHDHPHFPWPHNRQSSA